MTKVAVPTRTAVRYDETSSTVAYVGEASISASTSTACWRIRKMEFTDDAISITWADGDDEFDNIWDNRASLTYS